MIRSSVDRIVVGDSSRQMNPISRSQSGVAERKPITLGEVFYAKFHLKAPIKDKLLIDRITGDLYSATDGVKVPNLINVESTLPEYRILADIRNAVETKMTKNALNDPLVKDIRYRYACLLHGE
ncbi:MAG: hypothetical protein ACP5NW_03610 [Candidatus Woesearchaeota archaeon]